MYTPIARFFGQAVDLFHRRRMLEGEVPASGPVLLVANHPNGLIDAVLIMRSTTRPVRFLGKAPLFDMPVIGRLVKAARALPVYRPRDGHSTNQNQQIFAAVFDALCAGECVCLFPEGISHNEPSIQPLKTGAARMALGAMAQHHAAGDGPLPVQIVPVGLTYRNKTTFRSEVAVQVGEPLVLDEQWLADHAEDERATARRLTERIDDAMRSVTINLDEWDDLPLLELAGRIWADDNDPVVRLREMADAQRSFLVEIPEQLHALRQRLLDFKGELDALKLTPEALDARLQAGPAARFVLRNLVALLVGLPCALIGAAAYVVPYQLVRLLNRLIGAEDDIVGTVKLLASVLFFVPWHIFLVVMSVVWFGPLAGVIASIGLPLCGLYTHHFYDRRRDALHRLRTAWTLLTRFSVAADLRAEREAIRAEIDALANAATMPLQSVPPPA